MGSNQKESWRDEYNSYISLTSKITILAKRIKALTSRKEMYEQQRVKVKEANRLYMKKYKEMKNG